jgi:hypothetical protein
MSKPDPAFVDALTDLLIQADVAYRTTQDPSGSGPGWPQWYAARLSQTMDGQVREGEILDALLSAASAHGIHEQQSGPDPEWARWYAEHMASRLSKDWYRQLAEEQEEW